MAQSLCAADAVAVGRLCVDKYEASVWSKPPGGVDLGTQYGLASDDYPCADNAQDCERIYAASVPGTLPSGYATWFQAQQACANVGKRLLTNSEWQMAVQGTPDGRPEDEVSACNPFPFQTTVATGARSECKSIYGAYDMSGNVHEWVADWVPRSSACPGWGALSDDEMCLAGARTTTTGPGALFRGGERFVGSAGALAVNALASPAGGFDNVGFRCVR